MKIKFIILTFLLMFTSINIINAQTHKCQRDSLYCKDSSMLIIKNNYRSTMHQLKIELSDKNKELQCLIEKDSNNIDAINSLTYEIDVIKIKIFDLKHKHRYHIKNGNMCFR